MKIKLYLIVLLISTSAAFPAALKAMDISVGAYTWYATWKLKSVFPDGSPSFTFDFNSALMYGPLVVLKFDDKWSLSSLFLYSSRFTYDDGSGQPPFTVNRYDSDTLLNYNINQYLKAFAGIKYMYYSYTDMRSWDMGPGLGIGATLPVWDNFYLLMNMSGMYLKGKFNPGSTAITEYGFNIAANIAYYIEAISLTISAGYRYQLFRRYYSDDSSFYEENTFSGFTASVIYTF